MEVNRCRACFLEKDIADLCDWYLTMEVGDPLTYLECFQMCTQLDVNNGNDTSPCFRNMQYLCQDCIQELKISYRFLRKAQRSAKKLCFLLESKDDVSSMIKNTFEYVNIQEGPLGDEHISISQKNQQTQIDNIDEEIPLLNLYDMACRKQEQTIHLAKNKKEGSKYKSGKTDGENKQISCDHCKKMFPANKLKQHKSRYHRPKIFLCDNCPSSFSIANNLRRHQRTHDTNRERNFSCSDCGRTFFTEDVYRTHIKIHQTSRRAKFECNQCDKTFMHKGSLTLHIQKHMGPKNECNICQKRYVRKIDLDIHMRNHSGDLPYKCYKCDKAFMTTSALRKHEVLHTGVRYKCDICNKEYSHPSKLTRHILYHTGLPLKCALCNKGFAEPNKIRRHIRSVHKLEDVSRVNELTIKVEKNDKQPK
ncbi:zinc finger protein OZF isoform X1 [Zeugodacus cucurbitae]|uniref:zinc finger protein OZF isoform X1 n=2 Tax=Zeugodacus cucurbitae TaxID=28588 RepID=UPI0023D95C00|nr:zinc finger protein OZF isoform X1 [Zeugodacus cucurbitae]